MSHFDHTKQSAIANFVLENLPLHKQFALGTIDENKHPWVVCLNVAIDNEINIIWKSKIDTEHSKHIPRAPNVAICIFSESEKVGDFGFYAKALAHEVLDINELQRCLEVRYASKGKVIPPVTDFMPGAMYRMYSAKISEAWVNDDRHLKIKIDLQVLREMMLQRENLKI